jgi:hypothetical protein
MSTQKSIDELITTTVGKVRSVQQQLDLILLNDFPSENPKSLAEIIKRICERLEGRLYHFREKFPDSPSDVERDVKLVAILVMDIASHLRYIEGASVRRTPWSLVMPIQKLAQKIFPETMLIMRSQWHYNYAILEIIAPYKRVLKRLFNQQEITDIFSNIRGKIYIVLFQGSNVKMFCYM